MGLLSQWNIDKTNMTTVYNKSEEIHGSSTDTSNEADYLESLMDSSRKNVWRCYKTRYNGSGNTSPTTTHLTQAQATDIHYRSQDTSQNWAWGDNYTGVRECWLYFTNSYSVTVTAWTDDNGSVFLNGSQLTTTTSCTNKNVTLNFKKGLNHLLIAFSEQTGGDGCYIATNPFTMPNVKWGYGCFKS